MEFRALLHAMTAVFAERDCEFVSLTALGTVYGSDVIHSVLSAASGAAAGAGSGAGNGDGGVGTEVRAVVTGVDSMRGVYADQHDQHTDYTTHCSRFLSHLQTNPHAFTAFPALSSVFEFVMNKHGNALYGYVDNYLTPTKTHAAAYSNWLYMQQNIEITSSLFLRTPMASEQQQSGAVAAAGDVAGQDAKSGNLALIQSHKESVFRLLHALHHPVPNPSPHVQTLDHFFAMSQVTVLPSHSMATVVFMQQSPLLCAARGDVWVDHKNTFLSRCVAAREMEGYFSRYTHFNIVQRIKPMNERYRDALKKGSSSSGGSGNHSFFGMRFFDIYDKGDYEDNGRRCLRVSRRGYRIFPTG